MGDRMGDRYRNTLPGHSVCWVPSLHTLRCSDKSFPLDIPAGKTSGLTFFLATPKTSWDQHPWGLNCDQCVEQTLKIFKSKAKVLMNRNYPYSGLILHWPQSPKSKKKKKIYFWSFLHQTSALCSAEIKAGVMHCNALCKAQLERCNLPAALIHHMGMYCQPGLHHGLQRSPKLLPLCSLICTYYPLQSHFRDM